VHLYIPCCCIHVKLHTIRYQNISHVVAYMQQNFIEKFVGKFFLFMRIWKIFPKSWKIGRILYIYIYIYIYVFFSINDVVLNASVKNFYWSTKWYMNKYNSKSCRKIFNFHNFPNLWESANFYPRIKKLWNFFIVFSISSITRQNLFWNLREFLLIY